MTLGHHTTWKNDDVGYHHGWKAHPRTLDRHEERNAKQPAPSNARPPHGPERNATPGGDADGDDDDDDDDECFVSSISSASTLIF